MSPKPVAAAVAAMPVGIDSGGGSDESDMILYFESGAR
jgi:hypothetical protein